MRALGSCSDFETTGIIMAMAAGALLVFYECPILLHVHVHACCRIQVLLIDECIRFVSNFAHAKAIAH